MPRLKSQPQRTSGPLPNPRHELLAQEKAKGTKRQAAMKLAGYSGLSGGSIRAWLGEAVNARVAELHGQVAVKSLKILGTVENRRKDHDEALAITSSFLIARAEEARQLAMKFDNPAAAVSAIHVMAKIAGVWIDKRENLNRNVDQLTDDELAAYLTTNGSTHPSETPAH